MYLTQGDNETPRWILVLLHIFSTLLALFAATSAGLAAYFIGSFSVPLEQYLLGGLGITGFVTWIILLAPTATSPRHAGWGVAGLITGLVSFIAVCIGYVYRGDVPVLDDYLTSSGILALIAPIVVVLLVCLVVHRPLVNVKYSIGSLVGVTFWATATSLAPALL